LSKHARRFLPPDVCAALWYGLIGWRMPDATWALARAREAIWRRPGSVVRFGRYTIRIADGPTFFQQYRDIFLRGVYRFAAARPDPVIIDGGSNIGVSVLFFKSAYPSAQIVAFEPEPRIYRLLEENVSRNRLERVTLVNAGLGSASGRSAFIQSESDSARFGESGETVLARMERLSAFISKPVDFLKLNIEGQEFDVLSELEESGALALIRELVLDYHDWVDHRQRLAVVLDLLARNGFRYVVRDWERASDDSGTWPWDPLWSCLVFARRLP
jgi:FkbM family methyltransferase